jgi:phenylacetyl-CoA:acceptor oxidoreductase subunit 2
MMLAPTLQKRWDWRAAGNFICGGSGSGLMIMAALLTLLGLHASGYALLASTLVATGLGLVWLEIGRPLRSMNVFRNPRRSWMTREGLVATVLLPLGALAFLSESTALLITAAVPAALFLYAQARILHMAKGIPAWRTDAINPLIVSTGLTEGMGLVLIFAGLVQGNVAALFSGYGWILALALVFLRGAAWINYRYSLANNAPEATLQVLDRAHSVIALLGVAAPIVLLFLGKSYPAYQLPLAAAAGFFMVLCGWFCKYQIILRAAYSQGYAISRTPARGGGKPGPGLKPGWRLPQ